MSEPTIGVHFSHAIGDVGATLVQVSYGRLHASDINRQITLGAATRTESGEPKAHTPASARKGKSLRAALPKANSHTARWGGLRMKKSRLMVFLKQAHRAPP